MNEIILVGLGQPLRGDDQAGLEAVKTWQVSPHPEIKSKIRVELSELPGLGLLELLKGSQAALLVDAVQSGAPPGTIHLLRDSEWTAPLEAQSAHGWGVAETIRLGRFVSNEDLPENILLIGIEAGHFRMGQPMSPEVEASLAEVVEIINHQIMLLDVT